MRKVQIEDAMMVMAHLHGKELDQRWKGRAKRLATFLKRFGPQSITADALAMALETCMDLGYYPSFPELLIGLSKRLANRAKAQKKREAAKAGHRS